MQKAAIPRFCPCADQGRLHLWA